MRCGWLSAYSCTISRVPSVEQSSETRISYGCGSRCASALSSACRTNRAWLYVTTSTETATPVWRGLIGAAPRFRGGDGDQYGIRGVDGGELLFGETVRRQPVDPRERERDVSVLFDLDTLQLAALFVQSASGIRCDAPERAALARFRAGDPRKERGERRPRPQSSDDLFEREWHLRQPLEAAVEHDPVGVLSDRELTDRSRWSRG